MTCCKGFPEALNLSTGLDFGYGGCVIALHCGNISVYTIVGCGGVCTNVTIIVSVACRKGNTSTWSPPSPRLKQ